MVNQPLVPILAAQTHITIGGDGAKSIDSDLHDGHVKCAAAEVVNQDIDWLGNFTRKVNPARLVAVSDRRSGGLIDNVQNFEASDESRILCRFAANFIEVGRDCDDGFFEISSDACGITF